MTLHVRCYVDGLNFYYGIAKPLNTKWIDLDSLLQQLLSSKLENDIVLETKVFTARVSGDAAERQTIYLSALKKKGITVEMGEFRTHEKYQELLAFKEFKKSSISKPPNMLVSARVRQNNHNLYAYIEKTTANNLRNPEKSGVFAHVAVPEEKQTDVNLACAMVSDAYQNKETQNFDWSVLVSNDSDFSPALKILKRLNQKVLLIIPVTRSNAERKQKTQGVYIPKSLTQHVPKKNCINFIEDDLVHKHLLPEKVGGIACPAEWKSSLWV